MRLSVTGRSVVISVVLLTSAIALYRYSQGYNVETSQISDNYPSFEATKFNGEFFNDSGRLAYRASSDKVTYFKHQNSVYMNNLVGIYYTSKDNSASQGWRIRANEGRIVKDQQAVLQGDIIVTPIHQDTVIKDIVTPYLFFDMNSNTISSPFELLIHGHDFVNSGKNFLIDLSRKTVTIKENPNAVYYPNS